MSDATRYFTIPESEFAAWFILGPVGDPCTVDHYSIYVAISPDEVSGSSFSSII